MNNIKIGWSEVSLVPEGRKVSLAGQFVERISGEVETPITVSTLAIECGEETAIFCVCDLVSVSTVVLQEIRDAIPDSLGIPKDKIMVSAIHTHTSIEYAKRSDGFGVSALQLLLKYKPEEVEYVPMVSNDDPNIIQGAEARAFIVERAVKSIIEAWESRKEGGYAQGFGRAAIGMCRRVCYDDGSAKMWGDTNMANFTELEAGNDSGIEMLFTYDTDKKLTGAVVNIACPAQVLEHQHFISSDFPGKIKRMLREKYGDINFIYFISPAGDQCPRDMMRWVNPEIVINDPNIDRPDYIERDADPSMFDIKGAERAALRAVNEIEYEIANVENINFESELKHKKITVTLPVRRVTIAEKDFAEEKIKAFFEKCGKTINYADNANMMIYAGTLARYEYQHTRDTYDIEVHILRLGDIAFATNPYELFLNYGNKMRARSRAKQTFLIQHSCGSFGYLPTEKAEKGSHYSAFVSSGTTGHEGGDMLVRTTIDEINKMF